MPRDKKPRKEREPWTPWGKWLKRRRERIEQRRQQREERRRQKQLARQRRWQHRRLVATRMLVFVGLGVFACGIGMAVILVIGRPYPWQTYQDVTASIRADRALPEHRERWQSLGIEHYTITVTYRTQEAVCGPVTLEVDAGRIVDPPAADDLTWFPESVCDARLADLTVNGAFEWLNAVIGDFRPGIDSLRIEFNEAFGHPVYAEFSVYDNEAPADCCWTVEWRDFQPILD
ncbi:MAG: hypothetical protein GYB64_06100 [Chloroflexi bacterium]|nr:hypothetical protein [Chloroflexota bacterium]